LAPVAQTLEARGVWLNRSLLRWPAVKPDGTFKLYHSASAEIVAVPGSKVRGAQGALALDTWTQALPAGIADRFRHVGDGPTLALRDADSAELQRRQTVLVRENAAGEVLDATALQSPGALDDLYAAATMVDDLGATAGGRASRFKLWAPTARAVAVCRYASGDGRATAVEPMNFDAGNGTWSAASGLDLSGSYYSYLVDVFVRGVGVVRNRVTDPYSVSLTTDSKRSYVANLASPRLKPAGWDSDTAPRRIAAQTDMTVYELHLRDFSVGDASVPPAHRGKYLAFADGASHGMRHLKALAAAGITDLHLLPVFDIASVPEAGCVTPQVPDAPPDSEAQQAAVMASAPSDCFNWGYDPLHFGAPEGSYSSDASNGATRIVEFRAMVAALHRAGLRVGMDLVYNHTAASGQQAQSVLDRIVPGYYQRLDAAGDVQTSTCCANTATEHRMMGKLLLDSVLRWASEYHIDSFRFDLMAHQPRALMETLKTRLKAATGRDVPLIGEGWNFGEVANNARFRQASQLELNGSGIATFSDRARDAARGGSPGDTPERLSSEQGYINGLVYDPNPRAAPHTRADLMRAADMLRVGLAGSLRDYRMQTADGAVRPLHEIDYAGQPAGYTSQPDEVVNYVDNHDNHTLFDIDALKLPPATSREDRARVQILGAALTAFSQGIAYFHAGIETLRSKSLDRNSFDSGDWFNTLDWTLQDNGFGRGLPPQADNGTAWPLLRPLLADPRIKPTPHEIRWARDAFLDLLRIRASSTLFRLRSADEIERRLSFANTGPDQVASVLAARLDGRGLAGAHYRELMLFINVDVAAQALVIPGAAGKPFHLHPVQRRGAAADRHAAAESRFEPSTGRFTIPPRSAVVFVVD
jgi:pullulanase/glycogen debranching enzyme